MTRRYVLINLSNGDNEDVALATHDGNEVVLPPGQGHSILEGNFSLSDRENPDVDPASHTYRAAIVGKTV